MNYKNLDNITKIQGIELIENDRNRELRYLFGSNNKQIIKYNKILKKIGFKSISSDNNT
jgi:hypothetical protein